MDINRLMHVARWNMAINRAQYLKLALSLFLVMSLPLLLFVLKTIWMVAFTGNVDFALAQVPGTTLGTWMSVSFIFAWPILLGYTFHNLLTKQSRIKELTLPASNLEKFLFHALVTIVGSLLMYALSYLLLDLVQYLYVGLVFGFPHAQWVPYSSVFFDDMATRDAIETLGRSHFWLLLVMDMSYVAFLSTFVLGGAIKYKHNVLWTVLFHWAFWFVWLVILGLATPMLADLQWDALSGVDPDLALSVVKWGTFLVLALIIVGCWTGAYRLYTRAQITTRRNK